MWLVEKFSWCSEVGVKRSSYCLLESLDVSRDLVQPVAKYCSAVAKSLDAAQ
jgi:hypothetical protein